MFERFGTLFAVFVAVGCVVAGVFLAARLQEVEWVKRSGAAVASAEALIAILEQKRREKFAMIPPHVKEQNPYVEQEIMRAERKTFMVATSLAVSGEMLHGFGDLVFEQCQSLFETIHHALDV